MFEQVKIILEEQYKQTLNTYDTLKLQAEDYEKQFENDQTEDEYQASLKSLNKEYGLFKRGKEYKEKLNNLQKDYFEKLKKFKEDYNQYIELKKQMAILNVIAVQKKLDNLMKATSLKDIRMSEKEAEELITNGLK